MTSMAKDVLVRRVAITGLLAMALALLVVGFQLTKESNPNTSITHPAVKKLYPADGDLDLRQSVIGFKLDPAWTGRLEVDGRPIPEDQLRKVVGVNDFLYTPGPGTETGPLRPGLHTAKAVFWKIGESESQGSYLSWKFNVH